MADDQEKTEEPTPKKIEEARKDGNVPKSQDMSGLFTLFVAILAFLLLFAFMYEHVSILAKYYISLIGTPIDKDMLIELSIITFKELLTIVLPLAIVVAVGGVLGNLAQFGIIFTTKPLIPDLKKIDPIKGVKNLVSLKKLVEGIKITLKSGLTLSIAFLFFFYFIKELPTVSLFGLQDQLEWLRDKAIIMALVMLLITFVFALADIVIQRYQYFKGLRMSKQEIKDEMKNMDGDPLIKSKIRQKQMEMSKKRMMAEVPNADVVITNPTHYAVAIRYEEGRDVVPTLVAKGVDKTALKIKEIAREAEVHIVQNPPLARSLYSDVELDQEIPSSLYHAVAEVLAYVYKVNNKSTTSS